MRMTSRYSIPIASLLVATLAFAASQSPWTDWYKKGLIRGGMALIQMRKHLENFPRYDGPNNSLVNHQSLHDTYLVRPNAGIVCGPETLKARTADGTCNNLKDPSEGAALTRFGRNSTLEASHAPDEEHGLLDPDPRQISLELLTRDKFQPVPFLNMLAAAWIQFMLHDWVSHEFETSQNDGSFILKLQPGDPSGKDEMVILRTLRDGSRSAEDDHKLPPTYRNTNTHWWDGSQIYGSDQATQNSLRAHHDGLLRVNDDGTLPVDLSDHLEIAGFKNTQTWWLGLSLMHHLFVHEHNFVAARLKQARAEKGLPEWDDQTMFDHARLVTAAIMAKIHTVEWTPAILPHPILKQGMDANWFGILNPQHKKVITGLGFLSFFKTFDPVLDGIVGGATKNWDVPYTLTEEFVSVYRLHSLLPEDMEIRSSATGEVRETLPLPSMRGYRSIGIIKKDNPDGNNLADLLYSFGVAHPGALTLNNYPKFMQKLDEIPVIGETDMGVTDILRDRERGVPRYNEFRRQLQLKPITRFEDLTDDAVTLEKLKRIYKNDIEKLDLMIGCLAEAQDRRPHGDVAGQTFGFGETQFQVFLLMASRRLQADRFFTESYNADVYSQEGLDLVDQATFKTILLDNFPLLANALKNVDNAFNPWVGYVPPAKK